MIGGAVTGGTEVVQRFDAMPNRLREELRIGIERLSVRLTNKVKDKLNGEVLKVRTGLLRRSITQATVTTGDTVTGITSTAVAYARAHEYGFDGMVTVSEHLRRSKAQYKLAKFTKRGFETKASARKAAGTGEINVRSFERHMKLPEKSFLRSSLGEMQESGAIRDGIAEAVRKATT